MTMKELVVRELTKEIDIWAEDVDHLEVMMRPPPQRLLIRIVRKPTIAFLDNHPSVG